MPHRRFDDMSEMLILRLEPGLEASGTQRRAHAPHKSTKEKLTLLFAKFAFAGTILLAVVAGSVAAGAPAAGKRPEQKVASNEPTQPNAAELAASVVHHGDGVAAIVNDSVISDYDVRQRMALFIATSGVKPSQDSLNAIREQVLKELETEQMQLMEARKDNISISASDVDKAIDEILKTNHLTMDQLKSVLTAGG